MRSDTPLDYAVFQLSPKRSRCELFVSGEGKTEKLASGLLKPFVTHLKVAEEQVAKALPSIKLEVEKRRNAGTWFTKGTLERFVRFVSTPEVLDLANTFDAEMSQLEAARRIYSQGSGDQLSGFAGESQTAAAAAAAADITKKELLRAIDVRLVAVKQDLTAACARASAAGFTLENVSELLLFADRFSAPRLNEACGKFISLCQRRPELISSWKPGLDDRAIRSSSSSDMSIDDPATEESAHHLKLPNGPHHQHQPPRQEEDSIHPPDPSKSSKCHASKLSFSVSLPSCRSSSSSSSREPSVDRDEPRERDNPASEKPAEEAPEPSPSLSSQQPTRRLSVQDRINLFENKQKEQLSGSGSGNKAVVGVKGPELRRLSSDVSSSAVGPEKVVLRRWSGASDMSVELSSERKDTVENSTTAAALSSSVNSQSQKDSGVLKDTATSQFCSGLNESSDASYTSQSRASSSRVEEGAPLKEEAASHTKFSTVVGRAEDGGLRDQVASCSQSRAFLGKGEDIVVKDQAAHHTHFRTSSGRTEHVGLKDQGFSQAPLRAFQSVPDYVGSEDEFTSQIQFRSLPAKVEDISLKDASSQVQLNDFPSRVDKVGLKGSEASQIPSRSFLNRAEDAGLKDQSASQTQTGAFPSKGQEPGSKLKEPVVSQIQFKGFFGKAEGIGSKDHTSGSQAPYRGFAGKAEEEEKCDLLAPPSQWRSFPGKVDEVGKKELASSLTQFGVPFPTKVEELGGRDSGLRGMKLHRQSSAPEHSKKLLGKRDESISAFENGEPAFSGRKVTENQQMFDRASNALVDPVQKVRQSKGNQELNDELQMKADELEKLFAAHKLRVPGDQAASSRRSKLPDLQAEQVTSAMVKKPVEVTPTQFSEKYQPREQSGSLSNGLEFDFSSLMKMVNNQEYGNSSKQQLDELGSPEESRGKFYERYMQKRDAKLREEWGSKRAQKEAKMKAMQDNLERSRAEMKANFSGSAGRQDSSLHARRRAEKLRSFDVRKSIKNKEQVAEPSQSDEEDLPEFSELTPYGHDGSFNETLFSDGSSRSTHSKKLLPNRTHPSPTPRTPVAPLPRSSAKGTNPGSGRRRTQPENPLTQSVPNFSDLRKENTKPLTGVSKTSTRSQFRNYTRSKSTSEDVSLVKEEKPRRTQSMRKNSANSGELKDAPLNSDSVVLTPLRFSKEQPEQSLYGKIPRSGELKPFLRKGDGIGPGAGIGIAKLKASETPDNIKNEEDFEELVDHPEDSPDTVKEDDEEEFETASQNLKAEDFPADSDNEKSRLSQESEKSEYRGSENGEVLRSLSQADDNSVSAMAAATSKFNTSAGNAQDSPGESPASWISRTHHPFSYTHDASDIDASADSPIGSPASWNSHSLSQMMEADAARMRKKWGSAQVPILVANTSHQSRKDVTKGFKRLLKFGRKSRGAESLITDWVSATTSEGDDDTEDGRDTANRSSEDLRKTRMGFPQSHSSYDGFNEGDIFQEQDQSLRSSIPAPPANFKLREDHLSGSSLKAPRSFFSLSSFRSKGSETKPR